MSRAGGPGLFGGRACEKRENLRARRDEKTDQPVVAKKKKCEKKTMDEARGARTVPRGEVEIEIEVAAEVRY